MNCPGFRGHDDIPHARRRGFTLVELLAAVTIVGILASAAITKVAEARYRALVVRAMGDLRAIEIDLAVFEIDGLPLPATLADIGRGGMLDPWNQPYIYYPFPPRNGNAPPGGARRDRFLVPINSTYDLYSVGRDGRTSTPLTASASKDDVLRGNDGGFLGLGSRF